MRFELLAAVELDFNVRSPNLKYRHAAHDKRFSNEWVKGTRIAAAISAIFLTFMGVISILVEG